MSANRFTIDERNRAIDTRDVGLMHYTDKLATRSKWVILIGVLLIIVLVLLYHFQFDKNNLVIYAGVIPMILITCIAVGVWYHTSGLYLEYNTAIEDKSGWADRLANETVVGKHYASVERNNYYSNGGLLGIGTPIGYKWSDYGKSATEMIV